MITHDHYASSTTSCGVGVCAASGTTSCVSGHVVDSCHAGSPTGTDANCNGIDEDCSGTADDHYVSTATSCGVGVCAAGGSTSCIAGHVVDSCHAGSPTGTDANCNGLDEDCSGTPDDHYVSTTTSCGVGACAASGTTSCSAGHVVDSCHAGTATGADADCDGIDQDCSGVADDHYASVTTSCGVGICGATGATACVAGHVVDSCHSGSPTGSDTTCDGVDDDCDGRIDESYAPTNTSCGVGACGAVGITSCVAGHVVDSCAAGAPIGPDTNCDGIDDDCNGIADDHFVSAATSCGLGVCGATGATACVAGHVVDSCHAGSPTGADTNCNGIDEDCSGTADDHYASLATHCGVGSCAAVGATSCVGGAVVDSCTAGAPVGADADCDGVDQDCSGLADDNYSSTATSCGVGVCAATGSTSCVAGHVVNSCSAGAPTGTDADCDVIDQDCSGTADDHYLPVATSCGVGVCAASGVTACAGGHVTDSCTAGSPTGTDADCDGLDQDCSGTADDHYVSHTSVCGLGVCTASGTTSCVSGAEVSSCHAGAPTGTDAVCDGIDDDCDGHVDEAFVPYVSSCGRGVCQASGSATCVSGAIVDSCHAGSGTGDDSLCDGLDEDCDGFVDEAYVRVATHCGLGVCAASGATSCVSGAVVDSCHAGPPTAALDTTCNALDDDCDGSTDEDFVSHATSCGVGACAASGTTSCVAGSTVDSCAPAAPLASTDATCNGVDDDCDGTIDDDYVPTAVSCGVGVCVAAGHTVCASGHESSACTPGAPTGADTSCDGVDEDCDGSADEEFAPATTHCGVGACASAGATACIGGAVLDTCAPGLPIGSDATCNGIDEDCDAAVDEAFVPSCSGSSTVSCVSGAPVLHDCSNHDACDGVESCSAATCIAGTPPTLDDGNACTADACDPLAGVTHTALANGTSCSDGDPCNGAETCSAGSCASGTAPTLDDGNACTADACDLVHGVTHTPLAVGVSCSADYCNPAECDGAGHCYAAFHPVGAPCAPPPPTPIVFVDEERDVTSGVMGASIVRYTSTNAPNITSSGINWTAFGATAPEMVIDLVGSDLVALDRLRFFGAGNSNARHVDIDVSRATSAAADFVPGVSIELPNVTTTTVDVRLGELNARYARIRIRDNWNGQAGQGVLQQLMLLTRPRDGGGISAFEAGVPVTATSNQSTASRATDVNSNSASTFWQSSTPIAGQSLTLDLPGFDWERLDRVRLHGTTAGSMVRDFEIWGSSTTSDPSAFSLLTSATLPTDENDYYFFFPETNARYLQLRVLTNRGFASGTSVYDFQAITPHQGGLTVPFQSRTVAGGSPIVEYRWDFGDGTMSALENPTHTFPAPGSYVVTLTAQDAWGQTRSAQYLYLASGPPTADFTYAPSTIQQGDFPSFTDRSFGDLPLAFVDWNISTAPATLRHTAPGSTVAASSVNPGPLSVTLTATDVTLVRGSTTRTLNVVDIAPTIDVGSDQSIPWGQNWRPNSTLVVRDQTTFDSGTLRCHYDFGDGATADVSPCNTGTAYVAHAWAAPGTFSVVVTVTDSSGVSGTDQFFVEVTRRNTAIAIDPVDPTATGGVHPVAVTLADAFDATAPMVGRTVQVSASASTASAVTSAAGSATASVDLGSTIPTLVSASFAGDTLYNPSSTSRPSTERAGRRHRANCGTDFWVAFTDVCDDGSQSCLQSGPDPLTYELLFTGEEETAVHAEVPGTGLTANGVVSADGVGRISFNARYTAATLPGSGVRTGRSVHVTSAREICLEGYPHQNAALDGFLAIPTERLGTDYVVGGWHHTDYGLHQVGHPVIAVVGTADATSVTITPAINLIAGADAPGTGGVLPAGVPFTVTLNRGQGMAFRGATPPTLTTESSISGTIVHASQPVAVFGNHQCAQIPDNFSACNQLTEQIAPIDRLGSHFFVTPSSTRTSGYIMHVVAATDGTTVTLDGTVVATLARGRYYSLDVTTQVAHEVLTSAPALVMQFSKGTSTDGRRGDPTEILVPPVEQFGHDSRFVTLDRFDVDRLVSTGTIPGSFDNWLNVVARVPDIGGLRVDGAPITAAFSTIGSSGFAFAQVHLTPGTHRVTHASPSVSYGLVAYGWQDTDAYGFPPQMQLRTLTCSPSAMTAGDGVDNDCDGRTDEEIANGIDDDGDGLIDEDLQFVPDATTNVAPMAYDIRTSVREDASVSIVLSGYDANTDPLTYQVLTTPSTGSLTGSGQTYSYAAPTNFHGTVSFTYRACDPTTCGAAATVTIDVQPQNDPPVITMPPIVNVVTDGLVRVPGSATDPDGESACAITWSIVSGPPGMTIDPNTGDIYWVAAPIGSSASVTIRATDCHGASSTFTIGITLGIVDHAPFITSRPVVTARGGRAYSYQVVAVDPDRGDTIGYLFNTAPPAGMTINASTGLINWTPAVTDIGRIFTIEVVARDNIGLLSDPQHFDLHVVGDVNAPTVTVTATPATVLPGATSVIHVAYSDDEPGVTLDSVTLGGAPITLDGSGNYAFSSAATGTFEVVASVHDAAGNPATASTLVRVLDASDVTPPVVELTAPDADAVLTYLHTATGRVLDDHLYRWRLEARRADRGGYFTLASGTRNVDGALGTIDTTQLENGIYILRLYAEDTNGQAAEDTRPVRVEGGAKVGVVQLSFTDLVTDAIGIPVAVVRSYDSRNAQTLGDFGYGWSLDVRHGSVMRNRAPGSGFAVTSSPSPFEFPCSHTYEQQSHYVSIHLSDSEWYVFRPTLINAEAALGSCTADVTFEQTDGVHPGATLDAIGNTHVRATALPIALGIPTMPSDLTDVDTGEIFDPHRFVLTLRDGRRFTLSFENGIESITDANNNTVQFSTSGITATRGESVTFVRDARGRITQVLASGGRSVGYDYSASGNLAGFTDTISRRTSFEYRASGYPHHLTDIIDARGVRLAAMDYQSDGRLGQTCDPEGVCLHNTYDLGSQVMTTTDGVGVPTQYEYDQRGNVTRMRDGLGHETTYTYSAQCPDHLGTETDPLGHTTTTQWDPFTCDRTGVTRPVATGEDPATYTTSYTYDAAGHMLTETMESGGTIHHTYDAQGNEAQVLDDDGHVVLERSWDGSGRLLGETTRFGTTTYSWGSAAHPDSMLDGLGRVHFFQYDALGHVTSINGNAGDSHTPVITQTFHYDPEGRLMYADYGRGITVTYAYENTENQWTRITGPTFGTVQRRFSAAGRLIGWTLPNGDTHSRDYDVAGRLGSETNELGHITTYAYDDAGRRIGTTDVARGASTTYVLDDAGRTTSTTDPLHHTTSRTYDVRGATASMTDAASRTWTYATTPTSSTSTTPLGETTTSSSTRYGLPASTTFPGGASTASTQNGETGLDDSFAYPASRTDESGRTRSFGYDAVGGLRSATDLGGHVWSYDYAPIMAGDLSWEVESGRVSLSAPDGEPDAYRFSGSGPFRDDQDAARMATEPWQHGLRTVTSPIGETTTYHYDTEGHRDLVTLPNGGEHAMTSVHGHLDTETLPYGTTLSYTRDSAFRVTERTGSDGSLHGFTYGPGDRIETITDGTGTTTYDYDTAGRFAGLDYPTGGSVHYGRDALDQVTSISVRAPADTTARTTTYVRDASNRITEIHDPLGGVTMQTYDANGRLATRTLPNGIVSTYTYDARGRSDTIVHARADGSVIVSVDYDRNPSGEPYRITREDGTFVLYGYDSALRLTSERYFDDTSTQVDAITYAYDDAGNRTSRTTSAGTEVYHYAAGDQLTDITIGSTTIAHYDYDAAGRVIRRVRDGVEQELTYDADDHLVRVADPAGTNEVIWDFDAAGRRVRREDRTAGVTTGVHRYEVAPTLAESLESPHAVTSDGGVAQMQYVFAGERPLFRYNSATGEAVYYLQDSLASVVGLADETGANVGAISYDGFGSTRVETGSLTQPSAALGDFRFQGMWLDADTGAYYARARIYETETGRFTSRDPEQSRASDATSAPYVFVANRPTALLDPSGRITVQEVNTAAVVASILSNTALSLIRNRHRYRCSGILGNEEFTLFDWLSLAIFDGALSGIQTYIGTFFPSGAVRALINTITGWLASNFRAWVLGNPAPNQLESFADNALTQIIRLLPRFFGFDAQSLDSIYEAVRIDFLVRFSTSAFSLLFADWRGTADGATGGGSSGLADDSCATVRGRDLGWAP